MKAALSAIVVLACIAAPMYAPAQAIEPAPAPRAAGSEFFEKRIRPLLAEHCYQCHGKEKQESGLVLSSYAAIRKGGDRGTLFVPGEADQSLLVQAVRYTDDDLKMPPKGKLKDEQIADVAAWVNMGAPGPQREEAPSVVTALPAKEFDLAERRKHWAYLPVLPQPAPAVRTPEWSRSPIDRFILSRLDSAGLSPSPPAERRSLIRRATFALTGLPPTPEEVATFLGDPRPDAYERQIDRLLASPRFGERWGRHWLDVVRYSETLGFEFDYDLHNAWRYRDYVVRAFNADLPYDQFVVEHLAGDLALQPRRNPADDCNESILATGFFWMHEGKQTPVDIRQEQADRIDNQIDVLGKALLGQTIACARCHDHKFDAITTRDYYALAGYLKSSRYQQAFLDPPERMTARVEELSALRTRIDAAARTELAPIWLRQMKDASRYLLATRQVTAAAEGKTNAVQVATDDGLDATRLERWHMALQHESTANPAHPLRTWSQRTGKDESPPQSDSALPTFEEWSLTNSAGWFKTGDAFRADPLPAGQVVVGSGAARPIARLTTRGTDSGQVSSPLQGELRSPSFTLAKRYVHFRVAGQNARVNLVIDGYTLIMNPMYGKLTATPTSNVPSWRTMPVDRWVGHRAYIEISDSTIPMHGLNPPASTARVPHGSDGHLVLEDVVFSDDPNPPRVHNRINFAFAKRAAGGDLESLAAAYETLIAELISRWQSGQLLDAPDTESGIDLLNWLLENGLLDGEPEEGDAAVYPALVAKYRELEAALPTPQRAPALADGTGEDEFVFLRGNYRTLGERATRGPPEVLTSSPSSADSGSGRLELARRVADPANPLLSRVLVNRLWQHVFGEGLVRTPDDFGRMGQPPTHSELLDHLAAEFVRGEWSIKTAVRRMLASQTYRQISNARNHESERDPENRLLHRMPIRRLEAEAIRDSLLAISRRLNLEMHGPSVLPHVTLHMEGRGKPGSGPLDGDGRRSLYINARRNFLTPLLLAFDYPVTFTPIGRRGASALPSQALTLMNDPFVIQETTRWADRVIEQEGSNTEQRIAALYETAFARPPTADEVTAAIDFLQAQSLRHGVGSEDPRVWADLCHVLINVKEFIFID